MSIMYIRFCFCHEITIISQESLFESKIWFMGNPLKLQIAQHQLQQYGVIQQPVLSF